MFFTKAGRVMAWTLIVFVVMHLGYLIVYAAQIGPILPGHPRYAKFSSALEKDFIILCVAIALGILTEISRSLAARKE